MSVTKAAPGSITACSCLWTCQNLFDDTRNRKEPMRTGSVRVFEDTEAGLWRCQLILKVRPSLPTHNFVVFALATVNIMGVTKY